TETMVGEWMWKYVRKRRSFGVGTDMSGNESRGNEDGSGQRHKRWVWLAPYERAVMWSSKQPKDGAALLGKSGRKCKYCQKSPFSKDGSRTCSHMDSASTTGKSNLPSSFLSSSSSSSS